MRRLVPALVALTLVAASLDAQSALRNRNPRPSYWVVSAGIAQARGTLGDPVRVAHDGSRVTGGIENGAHLALGGVFRYPESAVDLRGELFFNELRGPTGTTYADGADGETVLLAKRDRTIGAGTTLLWRVHPTRPATAYLLTGAGAYYTMLTTAHSAGRADPPRARGLAVGVSGGLGYERPLFGRTYFAELRYHRTADGVGGTPFLPLTIGTRL